jgi:hypothetical protein
VDTTKIDKIWSDFMDILKDNAEGYHSMACGWIVEDVEFEKVEGKAKAFTAGIGWESVEAHMKYRDTQVFKDTIAKVREVGSGSEVVSSTTVILWKHLLI